MHNGCCPFLARLRLRVSYAVFLPKQTASMFSQPIAVSYAPSRMRSETVYEKARSPYHTVLYHLSKWDFEVSNEARFERKLVTYTSITYSVCFPRLGA